MRRRMATTTEQQTKIDLDRKAAPARRPALLLAGLLTFVPFQRQLGLPGLALEGIAGSFLLLYTLAFVPPPTAWLLALPDTTVYVLLALGLFWSISATA